MVYACRHAPVKRPRRRARSSTASWSRSRTVAALPARRRPVHGKTGRAARVRGFDVLALNSSGSTVGRTSSVSLLSGRCARRSRAVAKDSRLARAEGFASAPGSAGCLAALGGRHHPRRQPRYARSPSLPEAALYRDRPRCKAADRSMEPPRAGGPMAARSPAPACGSSEGRRRWSLR
jgi:hypothetical protein